MGVRAHQTIHLSAFENVFHVFLPPNHAIWCPDQFALATLQTIACKTPFIGDINSA